MICITIQGKNRDEIFDILDRPEVEMAEIRLDRCPLSDEDIEEVFSLTDVPLIATCRISSSAAEAERRLTLAIKSGAAFADLPRSAP